MLRCSIAFVSGKSVTGIFRVEFSHNSIPFHLRHDGCRRDAAHLCVSMDDRQVGDVKLGDGQAVYEDEVGRRLQGGYCRTHCSLGCTQDIQRIYHIMWNCGDSDGCGRLEYLRVESLAFAGDELLGVIASWEPCAFGQDYGGGDDRPGKGPATSLVDSGYPSVALASGPKFILTDPKQPTPLPKGSTRRVFKTTPNQACLVTISMQDTNPLKGPEDAHSLPLHILTG